eukprot:4975959-Amphidinium_carterae.1
MCREVGIVVPDFIVVFAVVNVSVFTVLWMIQSTPCFRTRRVHVWLKELEEKDSCFGSPRVNF